MVAVPFVNPVPGGLVDRTRADIYDEQDLSAAEAGETALMDQLGPASVSEQVAGILRRRIYDKDSPYPPRRALPSEADLAREYGRSRPLMNRALAILVSEDLVSAEQGRGTFVLPRRLYWAVIEVPRIGARERDEVKRLGEAAQPTLDAEPAVQSFAIKTDADQAEIRLTVECATVRRAAAVVYTVAEAACKNGGWDLDAAQVAAGPES